VLEKLLKFSLENRLAAFVEVHPRVGPPGHDVRRRGDEVTYPLEAIDGPLDALVRAKHAPGEDKRSSIDALYLRVLPRCGTVPDDDDLGRWDLIQPDESFLCRDRHRHYRGHDEYGCDVQTAD